MTTTRSNKAPPHRFLGAFAVAAGRNVTGELNLKGVDTLLRLHSDEFLGRIEEASCITGVAHDGEHLTLVKCLSPGVGSTTSSGGPTRYFAEVFPHYVLIGRRHIDPEEACISAIEFTTTDLPQLFYDFDAFGHVIDARPLIDAVLEERRRLRPVETGPYPEVMYFTGKHCIAEAATAVGRVSIQHRLQTNFGGPSGVFIRNRIVVSIVPDPPITLDEALDRMYEIACFLSIAAGRIQGIDHVRVSLTEESNEVPQSLEVYISHRWKCTDKSQKHRPHPADVPLDPIRHRAEFDRVLTHWIGRHPSWRIARVQYLDCLRKANRYGSERLVAAANMFDTLPPDAVPLPLDLSEDLVAAREECVAIFRRLRPGIDRDSVLSALGRIGKPSLPKKVAHRTAIVDSGLAARFPDLQLVTGTAVKCRNFFVHGSSDAIDYSKIEPLVPFLTDALEFVFAASDLIEAGWEATRWNAEGHSWGHSFARFRAEYATALKALRIATARDQ